MSDNTNTYIYDPTDEYSELESSSWIYGIGAGRRKTIDAIDAKSPLSDIQTFNNLNEMLNAVRELSLALRDGTTYMSPPEKALQRIEAVYNDLPEEAQQAFLNDHVLHRRINAARKSFNRWMGKKKRDCQMPSSMEAGPAKYPYKKAEKLRRYAHEGNQDLEERIGKIRSGANGAKQRALNQVGSSVAEHNAEKAEEETLSMREKLSPGDIVFNRDVIHGQAMWGVKRLNKKSVRLKRPSRNGDGFSLTTVDYDSDFLRHVPREEMDALDADKIDADIPEQLTAGYESAIEYLMGSEWVENNQDAVTGPKTEEDPYADEDTLSDEEQQQITESSQDGDLKGVFNAIGISTKGPFWHLDWNNTDIETPTDLVEHYDEHGNFQRVRGIGPAKSETIEDVIPLVRSALHETDDPATQPADNPA